MKGYLDLNKTHSLKKSEIEQRWLCIDATDLGLGKMASEISKILRGKYSVKYTRNMNMEIKVIVINTDKMHLAEKKWTDKIYYRHTGRLGGLIEKTAQQEADRHGTEKLLRTAVRRMMMSNTLRRYLLKNLYIFSGPEHDHQAQKPEMIKLEIPTNTKTFKYNTVYLTRKP